MSLTLTLSGNTSTLKTEYFPPIELHDNEYVCGLVDFQTYHSIPNIDEESNKFVIGDNTIIIPTGSYEIEDIEEFLKKKLEIFNTKQEQSQLYLKANNNTLKRLILKLKIL
jgi:hypothetical protein